MLYGNLFFYIKIKFIFVSDGLENKRKALEDLVVDRIQGMLIAVKQITSINFWSC